MLPTDQVVWDAQIIVLFLLQIGQVNALVEQAAGRAAGRLIQPAPSGQPASASVKCSNSRGAPAPASVSMMCP
jgi:hypothetical protein